MRCFGAESISSSRCDVWDRIDLIIITMRCLGPNWTGSILTISAYRIRGVGIHNNAMFGTKSHRSLLTISAYRIRGDAIHNNDLYNAMFRTKSIRLPPSTAVSFHPIVPCLYIASMLGKPIRGKPIGLGVTTWRQHNNVGGILSSYCSITIYRMHAGKA